MRRKTSLLDVCVLLLCLLLPGYAMAITRDEIIATCAEYAELSYNVDSTNVYPWNRHQGVACTSSAEVGLLGPDPKSRFWLPG
jgi:hypothetical protein